MSEYSVNVRQEDGCGDSTNGDENDDILDDLNALDDSEVISYACACSWLSSLDIGDLSRRIVVSSLLAFVPSGRKSKRNQWKKS